MSAGQNNVGRAVGSGQCARQTRLAGARRRRRIRHARGPEQPASAFFLATRKLKSLAAAGHYAAARRRTRRPASGGWRRSDAARVRAAAAALPSAVFTFQSKKLNSRRREVSFSKTLPPPAGPKILNLHAHSLGVGRRALRRRNCAAASGYAAPSSCKRSQFKRRRPAARARKHAIKDVAAAALAQTFSRRRRSANATSAWKCAQRMLGRRRALRVSPRERERERERKVCMSRSRANLQER